MDDVRIGFGGGCHWCTEAVFTALRGVQSVGQGFICAPEPDDSYSEAVDILYHPSDIPLEVLVEIHLRTHASTSNHKMRGKYRSAIYVHSDEQATKVSTILKAAQSGFEEPLVTRILRHMDFRQSDQRFQNYYERNASGPFCTRYIDPKLTTLRAKFARHLR